MNIFITFDTEYPLTPATLESKRFAKYERRTARLTVHGIGRFVGKFQRWSGICVIGEILFVDNNEVGDWE